ncbi:MAG: type II secretion system F family protein [Patescibacteria group bacterium]
MFQHIGDQEKVDLAKNLALMLKSGVPINEALLSLEKQSRRRFVQRILQQLRADIESGTSLSQAFEKHDSLFGNVFVSLIRTGEASGTMEENLRFLSSWLEEDYTLRQEIRAATLYPKIVLSIAFLIGGGLSYFVLPRFIPLFGQLKVDLPLITRLLLNISSFLQEWGLFVLIGVIFAGVGWFLLLRVLAVRRVIHRAVLLIPVFGRLAQQYQLAITNQLLYTLMKSGVPISDTLRIVSKACTSIVYQDAFMRIQQRVVTGTPLSEAFRAFPRLFPNHVLTMIAVGEKSGTLDTVSEALSEYYVKEVLGTAKKLPSIIEPLLLVVIALVVGFIAAAVILPIYQLTQGLTR